MCHQTAILVYKCSYAKWIYTYIRLNKALNSRKSCTSRYISTLDFVAFVICCLYPILNGFYLILIIIDTPYIINELIQVWIPCLTIKRIPIVDRQLYDYLLIFIIGMPNPERRPSYWNGAQCDTDYAVLGIFVAGIIGVLTAIWVMNK